MRYGMVPALGNVAYEQERPLFLENLREQITPRQFSEETARKIDDNVREIVHVAYERALTLLTARQEALKRCADALLEKETLGETELRRLLG